MTIGTSVVLVTLRDARAPPSLPLDDGHLAFQDDDEVIVLVAVAEQSVARRPGGIKPRISSRSPLSAMRNSSKSSPAGVMS
ncbi:MAG TPA: hypothetical protein VGM33_10255 [Baekduia sp.]